MERILENTLAQDLVAEDDIKPRFQALERLKEMGEAKIYKRAIHDLKQIQTAFGDSNGAIQNAVLRESNEVSYIIFF